MGYSVFGYMGFVQRSLSLCAHRACQLSILNIWKAWKRATLPFNVVQQSTVHILMGSRNILWVFVNTDEVFLVFVNVIWSHQIPMILFGPPRWTIIPCGNHHHWTTWPDKADSARRLMIMEISSERIPTIATNFILGAVNVSYRLRAVAVSVVLWSVWKAKIVHSTSSVRVMFTTRYT